MKQSIVVLFIVGSNALGTGARLPHAELSVACSQTKSDVQADDVYYCPMHPDVTSNKPGECSKCGMALVKKASKQSKQSKQSAAKNKILQAKKLLQESKRTLGQEGKFKCCIEDGCDRCVLDHQSCSCDADLKAGKPVCPDCYAGWQRGEGKDKTIKPGDVKTMFNSHKH